MSPVASGKGGAFMRLVRYRVYVWRYQQSTAATLMHELDAPSVESAIQAVLLTYRIPAAYYVWVVSPEQTEVDVHRYHVTCAYQTAAMAPVPSRRKHKQGGR